MAAPKRGNRNITGPSALNNGIRDWHEIAKCGVLEDGAITIIYKHFAIAYFKLKFSRIFVEN